MKVNHSNVKQEPYCSMRVECQWELVDDFNESTSSRIYKCSKCGRFGHVLDIELAFGYTYPPRLGAGCYANNL